MNIKKIKLKKNSINLLGTNTYIVFFCILINHSIKILNLIILHIKRRLTEIYSFVCIIIIKIKYNAYVKKSHLLILIRFYNYCDSIIFSDIQ